MEERRRSHIKALARQVTADRRENIMQGRASGHRSGTIDQIRLLRVRTLSGGTEKKLVQRSVFRDSLECAQNRPASSQSGPSAGDATSNLPKIDQDYTEGIFSTDPSEVEDSISQIVYLTCKGDEHRNAVRETNIIPRIVKLLAGCSGEHAAVLATLALRNLSYANHLNNVAIRDAGGISALSKKLCGQADLFTVEYATVALGNLACEKTQNCDEIRHTGAIPALIDLLSSSSTQKLSGYVAVTLGNLACQNSENCNAIREHGGIPKLAALCTEQADSPLTLFATVALRHLIRKSEANRQAARESNVVAHMQRILQEVPAGTVVSSARAVLAQLERHRATEPSSPECATPQSIAFSSSPEIGAGSLLLESGPELEDSEMLADKWTNNPLSSDMDAVHDVSMRG